MADKENKTTVTSQQAVPIHGSFSNVVNTYYKYLAIAPAVLLLVVVAGWPLLNLIGMGFSNITFSQGQEHWSFAGLDHFRKIFTDHIYGAALKNTLIFVVVSVTAEMLLGFFVAYATSKLKSTQGIYRTLMMLPILVPPIAIGSIWALMYNYEFGIINNSFIALGMDPVSWLGSADYALMSVIVVDVWHWVPFVFLICLAGFEALPLDVLEAAELEGARGFGMLRMIIFPLMWPTVLVALMFRTIIAFNVFDEVFLLTAGGPGTSSEVVSLYAYKVFFQQNRLGYGAALSITTILIVLVLILLYQKVNSKEGNLS